MYVIDDRDRLQIKEMAERIPEEQVACSHLDPNEQTSSNNTNCGSSGSSPENESSDNSTPPPPPLSNGAKTQVQKTERTLQDEPGVYITLVSLSNGFNELRRVRFR